MFNLKDTLNNIFTYKKDKDYIFNISNETSSDNSLNGKSEKEEKIYESLGINLDYMKSKYNFLINSDIVVREFTITIRSKQYHSFMIYIDGMVSSDMIDNYILKPLMMRNDNNLFDGSHIVSEAIANNITIRKVKKFDLKDYILKCLMPQNSVKSVESFSDIISGINSGNCALFVDTINCAYDIEVKNFSQRSVDKPNNEIVIKGAHEAFVENIRTNTSLIRRIINSSELIIESVTVGSLTSTNCAICYLEDITNESLITEVKHRINNLDVDSLLSSGQLEQLLSDSNDLSLPQILSTERPDKASSYLIQGRVIVLVNGSPYALVMPAVMSDFLSSPDDKNLKSGFSNFLKMIRVLAMFITLLLPGIYIAITSFHQEIVPTELLFSILSSRQNVPFPIILEILLLELSFELIREAGLRVPSPIGPTIRNCWSTSTWSSSS